MAVSGSTLTCSTDSRDEFEQLVLRTQRRAYNQAYRMCGNRPDAEDLTQETFFRAWRFFDKYDRTKPFENWLYTILSNQFIDGLRKSKARGIPPLSLDQPVNPCSDSAYVLEIPDPKQDPVASLLRHEFGEQIGGALNKLPKDFQTAVLLCDVQCMSYEEIAQAMGTSIGTVRSRIHRGRLMLRGHLRGVVLT